MEWLLCELDRIFDADPPEIKAGKLVTLELFAEARAIYTAVPSSYRGVGFSGWAVSFNNQIHDRLSSIFDRTD